jgi:hypothetical protein
MAGGVARVIPVYAKTVFAAGIDVATDAAYNENAARHRLAMRAAVYRLDEVWSGSHAAVT